VRNLKENGKVILCSMRVVDSLTDKTIFLYLANRYYDETDQYANELGLGDLNKGFKKPVSRLIASYLSPRVLEDGYQEHEYPEASHQGSAVGKKEGL
jgi:hypothetical protein